MEPEQSDERGSGRSQNVVHVLPRSMASVPRFLTGPLERIDPATGTTQLLVITADSETAVALAEAVLGMTGPAGIELLPVTSARRGARIMEGRPVLALAGAPRELRDLVRSSRLKLEGIQTVVLAWAEEILAGGADDIEALEALMGELPRDCARVVVTSRSEGRVNAFAERYLRRAPRDVPEESAEDGEPEPLQYVTVSAASRAGALQRLLDDLDPPSAAIVVSNDASETAVRRSLRLLGYDPETGTVRSTRGEILPSTYAVIFYDAPLSRKELAAARGAGPVRMVALAEPREIPGLRLASGELSPLSLSTAGAGARDSEAATRRELTKVLDAGLAAREILALEPLLDRHDGIEIAAAALRILERERAQRKAADLEVRQRPAAEGVDRGRPAGDRRPAGRDFGRGKPSPGRPREGDSRGDRRPPRDSFKRPPRRDRP